MFETICIEVLNFNKFNPRKDLKSTPWVRVNSDIFFSDTFDLLNAEERLLWFFLVTYAGMKNSSQFEVRVQYIQKHCGISEEALRSGIDKLIKLGNVRVTNGSDRIPNESDRTHEGTSTVTNGSDRTPLGPNTRTNEFVPNERTDGTNETKRNEQKNIHTRARDLTHTWKETLQHYGIKREPFPGEDILLIRKADQVGDENVRLALVGARYEQRTENFDPAKNVRLNRILDPPKFDKFVGLGIQARDGTLSVASAKVIDWDSLRKKLQPEPEPA